MLEVEGQLAWSSNTTLLATVVEAGRALRVVYKPQRGERPLWDFPSGTLCRREVAAYRISRLLGWDIVPPTVLREGPYGLGAVQQFVPHDPACHYLVMEDPDVVQVRRIVAFDVVTNNADRKSGHVLLGPDGRLWGIDHGLSFHVQPKLRTVIWEHAGEPLPPEVVDGLERLLARLEADAVRSDLTALITPREVDALIERTDRLLTIGHLPAVEADRRMYPWPPV